MAPGREAAVCENCGCVRPEKGRKPRECTPEQIEECHGDAKEHPCADGEKKDGGKS